MAANEPQKSGEGAANGGHNPNPGFGSIDQSGVLIDVSSLNSITVSRDRKSVSVGAGNRWGRIYEYLDPYGVSAVGARNPLPGVSGFISGGGKTEIRFVVLGDSTIVNANNTVKTDLFWALKGGGPNYGIVTRYDLRTIPNRLWYALALFNGSDYRNVEAAIAEVQENLDNNTKASFFTVASGDIIEIGMIHDGWTSRPPIFDPFFHLQRPKMLIQETNNTVNSLSQALLSVHSTKATVDPNFILSRQIFGLSHKPSPDLYEAIYNRFRNISVFPSATQINQSWTMQPINRAAVQVGIQRGANAMAVPPITQTWSNSVVEFSSLSDNAVATSAISAFKNLVSEFSHKAKLDLPFIFQNDANTAQSPLGSSGAAHAARLTSISRKYDPEQVFQLQQFGGFKVSEA
ncbi:MAG: hypothetical protein Q9190_000067 [Brigantiaea leucoxantha]